MKIYRCRRHCVDGILCALILLNVGISFSLAAQQLEPIALTIGNGSANAGGTAEINIHLQSGADKPSALIMFIEYDPDEIVPSTEYYELGAILPAQAVLDAGKVFDIEVHPEGVLAIAITGLNSEPIPDGIIVTIAFQVAGDVPDDEIIELDGIDPDNPTTLEGEEAASSASSATGFDIPIIINDGQISLDCVPPDAPTNVAATQGRADAVLVTWDSQGAEYRVYRSNDANVNNAAPIGDYWQTNTEFLDTTAQQPVGFGCFKSFVRYYYWVKARTETGCESGFSTPPAEGYRGR